MNGIIINDEVYEVVESNGIECDKCALKDTFCEVCSNNGLEECLAEVIMGLNNPKIYHFIKTNKNIK